MQTTATGRMSAAVKSGSRALESRMPGKRARPVWRRGRRKRVARYLAGGLLYLGRGKGRETLPIATKWAIWLVTGSVVLPAHFLAG